MFEAYCEENEIKMNVTGLFFRCCFSQAYLSAEGRREARGVKFIQMKDWVTLIFFAEASRTEKLPIAFIGRSAAPT